MKIQHKNKGKCIPVTDVDYIDFYMYIYIYISIEVVSRGHAISRSQ